MERRDFFKNAGIAGLCSCFVAQALAAESTPTAAPQPAEDWRIEFGRRRYSKLVTLLAATVDAPTFQKIIEELGSYCSESGFSPKFAGRLEEYLKEMERRWGAKCSMDAEHHLVHVAFEPQNHDCACPLMGKGLVPAAACHCSVGAMQRSFTVVTGKPVTVDLDESVLRGNDRCAFTIHTQPAEAS